MEAAANIGFAKGIVQLTLTRFRSYNLARFECTSCPVVLTGDNGAGKTNVLEAISWLSPGRGLRRATLSEVIHRQQNTPSIVAERPWGIVAKLQHETGEIDLATGLDPQAWSKGREKRVIYIDGKAERGQSALAEQISIIWLTPQMDRLFVESSSERRRFVDRLVYTHDVQHSRRVQIYEHAMRERSRLLRTGSYDPQWMGILEQRMAQEGVAVAAARRDFLQSLAESFKTEHSHFPTPLVAMEGALETMLLEIPASDLEAQIQENLAGRRIIDAERGGASIGPHRSDFSAFMAHTQQRAALCSTGEQKALLIAIILATARLTQFRNTSIPILLLDEIVAHLDLKRREILLRELASLGIQCWLTGTDPELFQPLKNLAHFFHIEKSTIT